MRESLTLDLWHQPFPFPSVSPRISSISILHSHTISKLSPLGHETVIPHLSPFKRSFAFQSWKNSCWISATKTQNRKIHIVTCLDKDQATYRWCNTVWKVLHGGKKHVGVRGTSTSVHCKEAAWLHWMLGVTQLSWRVGGLKLFCLIWNSGFNNNIVFALCWSDAFPDKTNNKEVFRSIQGLRLDLRRKSTEWLNQTQKHGQYRCL